MIEGPEAGRGQHQETPVPGCCGLTAAWPGSAWPTEAREIRLGRGRGRKREWPKFYVRNGSSTYAQLWMESGHQEKE